MRKTKVVKDFDFYIDEYMYYCRSRKLRPKTMQNYEQTLRLFERWCKEKEEITEPSQVRDATIRRYICSLEERGKYTLYVNEQGKERNYPERRRDYRKPVSVATINNYIRNLRVFFNWLERDYIIRRNPMKKIRQLKYNRQAKVFLSDEDLKKLLSESGDPSKELVTDCNVSADHEMPVTIGAIEHICTCAEAIHDSIQEIGDGAVLLRVPCKYIIITIVDYQFEGVDFVGCTFPAIYLLRAILNG